MTQRRRIYRALPDYPATLQPDDEQVFPINFMEDPDYQRVDRVAGIWLSFGPTVIIDKTKNGYRMTLDHPQAVP